MWNPFLLFFVSAILSGGYSIFIGEDQELCEGGGGASNFYNFYFPAPRSCWLQVTFVVDVEFREIVPEGVGVEVEVIVTVPLWVPVGVAEVDERELLVGETVGDNDEYDVSVDVRVAV
jgi:hypothetical protein